MSCDTLSIIIAAGKELGYTDQELKDYVKELQDRLRDKRVLLREKEKEEWAYRLELEKLDQAMRFNETVISMNLRWRWVKVNLDV